MADGGAEAKPPRTARTRLRRLACHVRNLALTTIGLVATILLLAWVARPNVQTPPPAPPAAEVAAALRSRDVSFDASDPSKLPTLHVNVDYATGQAAPWWPKGESPLLKELVATGALPPVAERVGPQPIVMRGAEGVGRYGGTWYRAAISNDDIGIIEWRMSDAALFRFSPLGYPIQPHLATGATASADGRVYTVTLRRGVRWSDGAPFTADDIVYWWEAEQLDPAAGTGIAPPWLRSAGQPARIEKVDDYTLRFTFAAPFGQFVETLAASSTSMTNSPRHYLIRYHPTLGDPEFIRREMRTFQMPTPAALYTYVKQFWNPECPRLWPWVYRTYRSTAPHVFVRNPYYYCVDEAGNQLPYIDRLQFQIRSSQTLPLTFVNGEVSMQARHVRFDSYTDLMSRHDAVGTRILHWYPGTRSTWVINPNLNRRVDPADPSSRWKAHLLGDKHFRQALSLAIDRDAVARAEFAGQVQPAQVEPGEASPFHNARLAGAFVRHDPAEANRLLDALGLTRRDVDGMRTFPDGSRMVFFLDYTAFTGGGPAQFVVDDWAEVGVRAIAREQSRLLFQTRKDSGDSDFCVWTSESDVFPLLEPRYFVPASSEAFYAQRWGRWYTAGGLFQDVSSVAGGKLVGPPTDHPIYRAFQLYEQARQSTDLPHQQQLFKQITDIAADNLWTINLCTAPPQPVVVDKDLRNVPTNAIYAATTSTPGNTGMELYYFRHPSASPGADAELKRSLVQVIPRPRVTAFGSTARAATSSSTVGRLIRWTCAGIGAVFVALLVFRHPFLIRRLALMVPTLFIVSIVVFTIIQLPPGDFLTSRIAQFEESGDPSGPRQIEELRKIFHFDEPVWKRYARWVGLHWFVTFDPSDTGLLQGDMGRSMESRQPVNAIVGDRIVLTVLISAGTLLFTWLLAIPIGIYSAARQYSRLDYALTLLGFLGMSVPGFLLALVMMSLAGLGAGLFSPAFDAQPEWDWPKVLDLLRHIWVPILVLGVGGTAGMIRVMRANLLDELRKPYVTTARAKGVRPLKLLFKYPVRVALNPFVSGIGTLFPQLVSGGAIVAMVLALPTVGPLMLSALFSQDMYLAGSMLMVLSLLGIVGTLVSDLLLLWLDPRIRYEGGTR